MYFLFSPPSSPSSFPSSFVLSSNKKYFSYGLLAGASLTLLLSYLRHALLSHSSTPLSTVEERLLHHVVMRSANDSQSILHVMDDFHQKDSPLSIMSNEDISVILDQLVGKSGADVEFMLGGDGSEGKSSESSAPSASSPFIVIEIGSYLGYSTIHLIQHLLKQFPSSSSAPLFHIYSIESNPLHACIATKLIEFSSLSQYVTVIIGKSSEKIGVLNNKYGVKGVGAIVMDYENSQYIPDIQAMEKVGIIAKDTKIVMRNTPKLFDDGKGKNAHVKNFNANVDKSMNSIRDYVGNERKYRIVIGKAEEDSVSSSGGVGDSAKKGRRSSVGGKQKDNEGKEHFIVAVKL